VKGRVTLHDLTEENYGDEEILRVAERVETVVDAELDRLPQMITPNIVELETTGGRRFVRRIDFVKGSPQDPMSLSDCVEKFHDCVAFSVKPIDRGKIAEFIGMAMEIERVDDVVPMVRLLVA
jgi:2-methylcitrate dehydratase PrpD